MAYRDPGPRVGVTSGDSEVELQLLRDQHRSGVAAGRRRPFRRHDRGGPQLDRVRADVAAGLNIMPALVEAARARASIGQMCDAVAAGIGQPRRQPASAVN